MEFHGINYLAVGIALIVSMLIGALWYGVMAKPWMKAVGLGDDDLEQKPSLYIIAVLCQAVMAWMLAGLIGHLGTQTLVSGMFTGILCWIGFVATTITVNHRFQDASWSLTGINVGHWLLVLAAQGAIIGWMGI